MVGKTIRSPVFAAQNGSDFARILLNKWNLRELIYMIMVSKAEMKALRERFPGLHARRTVNKYYVEENQKVVAFLKSLSGNKGDAHGK